ncbi:TetR/AcrR family transcriptional regulator [Acetobacterium woodii]|uniref:Transcriptional regulator TetR family n=1 Tax=Acetobacterium woodii (strain ATCC 29683 / DSM 1030 / JCM 2381 / KCTC 1655 / WB1) TaxID=931626 RepID=H6LG49_ACEWD|nr:TetR/AcrR family transcriptional regulator [Acetobacterium woodii]AFA49525.1 transcriptional regulator TetR family [Acetobacterium woodii DSM 1030]
MGRRKKELTEFNRDSIIKIAETLFAKNGVENTTMNDIAKAAEYSKATLYVYFENKEEIVNCIILKSMKMLYDRIDTATQTGNDLLSRYYGICNELTAYCDEYPLYFQTILQEINVDVNNQATPPVFREIFELGEQINDLIGAFFKAGIKDGVFRADLKIPETVFIFWASLSGIILMAWNKQQYIEQTMETTKADFLTYSFDTLLNSILKEKNYE